MGQNLSRKAGPARGQFDPRQDVSERGQSRQERQPSKARVNDSWTTPKASHRNVRTAFRARTANGEQRNNSHARPLKEFEGNVGPPRRQQKHGKGNATKDQSKPRYQQRAHSDNGRRSHDRPKSQKTRTHHPNSGSRHTRLNPIKECIVCTDTRPVHRFPDRAPTEQCTHNTDVCRRCLRTWIQSEFSSKIWNEINCPICAARLQYDDIKEFAPQDVFRRYAKLTTKAVYDNIPNWRWCLAKGCKSGQIHTPGQSKFRCKKCKKSHCVEHGSPWHKGETCQEYNYRTNKSIKKQEEAASKKVISETTKKCPGCKRSIEKSFGCDHMTCSRCKHQFCWQCLAPYVQNGIRGVVHRQGCQYYSPAYYDPD